VIELIAALLLIAAAIWLTYVLFALVGNMARDRGHNPWPWWLLSLSWSPIGSIVIMWLFFAPIEASKHRAISNNSAI
jgi:hypothetical protein